MVSRSSGSGRPGIPSDAHEVSLRFVFLHGQSETGYDVTIGLR
jgi:hypothetical protein